MFVFLGLLMEMTGIARVMVAFLAALVGHVRGGLAYVLLGAMYLVSGISGSKAADMAAVAPILFPPFANATIAVRSVLEPTVNALYVLLSPQWKKVPASGSKPQPSPQATPVRVLSMSVFSAKWLEQFRLLRSRSKPRPQLQTANTQIRRTQRALCLSKLNSRSACSDGGCQADSSWLK